MSHLDANVKLLSELLEGGDYQAGSPKKFVIFEPKRREIHALPFVDRVVHHAVHGVISPIFEKTFFPQSYGCRKGKGTHKGAKDCQAIMRRMSKQGDVWILKTDFAGYFYNIDRAILHKQFSAKISCKKTLDLITQYIPRTGTGINIGYLLSQLSANIYGTILDKWLVHEQKITQFIRYMDDVVIFGKSRRELIALQRRLEVFCAKHMKLRLSHWSVTKASQGVNFLGYRIWTTHKLLRKQSVQDAKRKISMCVKHNDTQKLSKFLGAWLGHARHADSYNLIKHLEETHYERIGKYHQFTR